MLDRIEEALGRLASDSSASVREAASAALDRTRAKRSLEAFRSTIRGGAVEEKIRTIFAAEELGGTEGVLLLTDALRDGEAEVRGAAVRALAPFLSPPVLKLLWEMLPREKGFVLANLVETLASSGRKELAPHVEKFLDHPDPEVRSKAVRGYARLCDRPGWEKIVSMSFDPNETVRAAVADALGAWTDPRLR